MRDVYFGYTLSRLLEERDMRPSELARLCNVNRMNVYIYTTGKRMMPCLDTAKSFADALGLTLDRLWDECERDFGTRRYEKWVLEAKERRSPHPQKNQLVAGEGVEPPTQGFSVPRPCYAPFTMLSMLKLLYSVTRAVCA